MIGGEGHDDCFSSLQDFISMLAHLRLLECVFHFASELLPTQIGGYYEERDGFEETRFL